MGTGRSVHAASSEDASIVIVGGGYGGITLANHLKSTGKMKLISPSSCFFHNIGALRSCVEPEFANKIFIPFKETFGDSFVQGKVVAINKESKSVTLDSGEEIRYSHLVLATGSGASFPGKMTPEHERMSKADSVKLYRDLNKEVEEAETVVLIGGGAVGTELSGEIKTDYPKKKVVLIHPNKSLCSNRLKPSAQSRLQATMARKGVELMLEERVANLPDLHFNKCVKDQVVKTESGKEIKADLIFRCTGVKPATDVFKDALGDAVTENGLIKVDDFLKVQGTDNTYAIGDITAIEEEKMAVAAMSHADLVAKNLIAGFKGKKMEAYKTQDFMMVVPIGRDGGVSQLFGMVVGDFITKTVKSKGLLTSKFWEMMKQKPPSKVTKANM